MQQQTSCHERRSRHVIQSYPSAIQHLVPSACASRASDAGLYSADYSLGSGAKLVDEFTNPRSANRSVALSMLLSLRSATSIEADQYLAMCAIPVKRVLSCGDPEAVAYCLYFLHELLSVRETAEAVVVYSRYILPAAMRLYMNPKFDTMATVSTLKRRWHVNVKEAARCFVGSLLACCTSEQVKYLRKRLEELNDYYVHDIISEFLLNIPMTANLENLEQTLFDALLSSKSLLSVKSLLEKGPVKGRSSGALPGARGKEKAAKSDSLALTPSAMRLLKSFIRTRVRDQQLAESTMKRIQDGLVKFRRKSVTLDLFARLLDGSFDDVDLLFYGYVVEVTGGAKHKMSTAGKPVVGWDQCSMYSGDIFGSDSDAATRSHNQQFLEFLRTNAVAMSQEFDSPKRSFGNEAMTAHEAKTAHGQSFNRDSAIPLDFFRYAAVWVFHHSRVSTAKTGPSLPNQSHINHSTLVNESFTNASPVSQSGRSLQDLPINVRTSYDELYLKSIKSSHGKFRVSRDFSDMSDDSSPGRGSNDVRSIHAGSGNYRVTRPNADRKSHGHIASRGNAIPSRKSPDNADMENFMHKLNSLSSYTSAGSAVGFSSGAKTNDQVHASHLPGHLFNHQETNVSDSNSASILLNLMRNQLQHHLLAHGITASPEDLDRMLRLVDSVLFDVLSAVSGGDKDVSFSPQSIREIVSRAPTVRSAPDTLLTVLSESLYELFNGHAKDLDGNLSSFFESLVDVAAAT